METDVRVRKVVQDVLLYIWFKVEIISTEQSPDLTFLPEISAELMENLSVSVCFETFNHSFSLHGFIENHFQRMTSSSRLFAEYVAYACYIQLDFVKNAYDGFLHILSIVAHMASYCWQEDNKSFLNATAELFCSFFEKELRAEFEKLGGWKNLNAFLKNQRNFERNKKIIRSKKSELEIFHSVQYTRQQSKSRNGRDFQDELYAFSEIEVETHKKAIAFADSVANKIENLCQMTFNEVLMDFTETNYKVEKLYREENGDDSFFERMSDLRCLVENEKIKIKAATETLEGFLNVISKCPNGKLRHEEALEKSFDQIEIPKLLQEILRVQEPFEKCLDQTGLSKVNAGKVQPTEESSKNSPCCSENSDEHKRKEGESKKPSCSKEPSKKIEGKPHLQEKALKKSSKLIEPTKKLEEKTSNVLDSLESDEKGQNIAEPNRASFFKSQHNKKEKVQQLLQNIASDIDKLTNLIKSACEHNADFA